MIEDKRHGHAEYCEQRSHTVTLIRVIGNCMLLWFYMLTGAVRPETTILESWAQE